MSIAVKNIVVKGDRDVYVFEIHPQEDGALLAVCTQPNGGLNTVGWDWNELLEKMIVDCVATWETAP